MLIIIKNIPQGMSKPVLADLLKTTVADAFWFGRGEVKDVHMVQAETRKGRIVEYHCVSMIEPDPAAKRVIRILTGRTYLGANLKIGEYVVRNWRNDRRQGGQYKHIHREQRVGERRRHLRIASRST